MKKKRFFYHYYKQKKAMSVHFDGKCHVVMNIICNVPCETKWNDKQPNLVMRGFASKVLITDNVAYID
jgi:hypothetical protein